MASPEPSGSSGPATPAPTAPKPLVPPKAPPREIPAALRPLIWMGIPRSVLAYRPKPPSRNTSIFLLVTTSMVSLWYYDRRECRRLRQEYVDQVKHLSEAPLSTRDYPRKITVYGAKFPGDDDEDRAALFFRRHVKPILVAAGMDWEILTGKRHGGLGRELRERIYARRRQLLGLEPWGCEPDTMQPSIATPQSHDAKVAEALGQMPFALSPYQQMERELQGASVIVGRPAYKEFMWGLKQGWGTKLPPQRSDLDEPLANELANDDKFDELPAEPEAATSSQASQTADPAPPTSGSAAFDGRPEEELDEIELRNRALLASADDDEGAPLPSSVPGTKGYRPGVFQSRGKSGSFSSASSSSSGSPSSKAPSLPAGMSESILEPPSQMPAQPPLAYVDYIALSGWRNIPLRIAGFFNHRKLVRLGGEAGVRIAMGTKENARGFDAPRPKDFDGGDTPSLSSLLPPQGGDLDWGLGNEERYFNPAFYKLSKNIDKESEQFYSSLPRKLRDTRTLVRGQREPTKMEKNDPPKTEAELKGQRLENEKRWRNAKEGISIVRGDTGVVWDERWRGSLRVLRDVTGSRRQSPEQPSQ